MPVCASRRSVARDLDAANGVRAKRSLADEGLVTRVDDAETFVDMTEVPHLQLEGFLGSELLRELCGAASQAVARHGPEPPVPPPPSDDPRADHGSTGFEVDLGQAWEQVAERIRAVAPVVRQELGLAHFVLDRVHGLLTVHRPDGTFHSAPFGEHSPRTRRIEFVYTFAPDPDAFTGGVLRLYRTEDHEGFVRATDDATDLAPVDDAIAFFPSDAHHDISRIRPVDERPAIRFTLSGWLSGDPWRRPA